MTYGFLELLAAVAMSLALVCILAPLTPYLQERWSDRNWGEALIGAIFGAVVIAEMLHPLEPMAGLIVDMRALPLVLAGAFLGTKGVLTAVLVSVLGRLAIGGIGTTAGMISMVMYAAVGVFWAQTTASQWSNQAVRLLALPFLSVAGLLTAAILPEPARSWFFWNAAPSLAVTYFVTLPPLVLLFEHAVRRSKTRIVLRPLAFQHRNKVEGLRAPDGPAVANLGLRFKAINNLGTYSQVSPQEIIDLAALRLKEHIPWVRFCGEHDAMLLVPLTESRLIALETVRSELQEALLRVPLRLPDGLPLSLEYELVLLGPDLKPTLEMGHPVRLDDCATRTSATSMRPDHGQDTVFAKASLILKSRHS